MTRPDAASPAVTDAYERWGARLVAYAQAVAGSRDAAEDAVHTVFAALAARPELLARAQDPAAYLFAAARHEARNQRARALAVAPVEEGWLVAREGERLHDDDVRDIERAVGELPEEQREAVTLRIWGGLTFPQMAEATGVSERTLESRYRTAIEKLRPRLKGHA